MNPAKMCLESLDRRPGIRERRMPAVAPRLWCRFLKLSSSDFTERHQAALRLVPQHKPYAPKALQERYTTNLTQFRVVAQHARQPVKGNTTAEMVHVMDADVSCEPAQQYRKIVM